MADAGSARGKEESEAPATLDPPRLANGGRIGRDYVVSTLIGRGATSDVYAGRHEGSGTRVAIKVAHAKRVDAESLARFKRESRTLAAVRHPGVPRLHDADRLADGSPYLVMELVEGDPLDDRLGGGRMSIELATNIARQVLEALEAVHAVNAVHRDVSPANVILWEDDAGETFVKLVDFGIAKMLDDLGDVTRRGTILGTPPYLAPEQVAGGIITPRTDLYAVGVLLFEMVTGKAPFRGRNAAETLRAISTAMLPSVRLLRPDCPRTLEATILRAMQRTPAARFDTARAMIAALDRGSADSNAIPLVRKAPVPRETNEVSTVRKAPERPAPVQSTPAPAAPVQAAAKRDPRRATLAFESVAPRPAVDPRRATQSFESVKPSAYVPKAPPEAPRKPLLVPAPSTGAQRVLQQKAELQKKVAETAAMEARIEAKVEALIAPTIAAEPSLRVEAATAAPLVDDELCVAAAIPLYDRKDMREPEPLIPEAPKVVVEDRSPFAVALDEEERDAANVVATAVEAESTPRPSFNVWDMHDDDSGAGDDPLEASLDTGLEASLPELDMPPTQIAPVHARGSTRPGSYDRPLRGSRRSYTSEPPAEEPLALPVSRKPYVVGGFALLALAIAWWVAWVGPSEAQRLARSVSSPIVDYVTGGVTTPPVENAQAQSAVEADVVQDAPAAMEVATPVEAAPAPSTTVDAIDAPIVEDPPTEAAPSVEAPVVPEAPSAEVAPQATDAPAVEPDETRPSRRTAREERRARQRRAARRARRVGTPAHSGRQPEGWLPTNPY